MTNKDKEKYVDEVVASLYAGKSLSLMSEGIRSHKLSRYNTEKIIHDGVSKFESAVIPLVKNDFLFGTIEEVRAKHNYISVGYFEELIELVTEELKQDQKSVVTIMRKEYRSKEEILEAVDPRFISESEVEYQLQYGSNESSDYRGVRLVIGVIKLILAISLQGAGSFRVLMGLIGVSLILSSIIVKNER